MSAVRKIDHEIEAAGTALMKLHELAMQIKQDYGFITKIEGPEDYEKATAMLHELTSRKLVSRHEESLLDELAQTLLAYEENAEQFAEFNAEWGTPLSPVELLKAFMESAGLTGSDLPEIGDKTVVSKVLNGRRKISAKMAVALANRFHTEVDAFLESPVQKGECLSGDEMLELSEEFGIDDPFDEAPFVTICLREESVLKKA